MSPSQHNLLALPEWSTVDAGNGHWTLGDAFVFFLTFHLEASVTKLRGEALWEREAAGSGSQGAAVCVRNFITGIFE